MSKLYTLVLLLLIASNTYAADYYWVGGSGNWSDFSNHWATTSGGNTFHLQVPTLNDDVYFDLNSFTGAGQTVTNDQTIIYCRSMDWTGVTNATVSIYPNPANDNLTIELPFNASNSILDHLELYNSAGQSVLERTLLKDNNKTSLKVSDLPNGIYFLILTNKKGDQMTSKIRIEH